MDGMASVATRSGFGRPGCGSPTPLKSWRVIVSHDLIERLAPCKSAIKLRVFWALFDVMMRDRYYNRFRVSSNAIAAELGCSPGAVCDATRWLKDKEIILPYMRHGVLFYVFNPELLWRGSETQRARCVAALRDAKAGAASVDGASDVDHGRPTEVTGRAIYPPGRALT